MGNPYFRFKQFIVNQDQCAMKVTTDACLFGAWCAEEMKQTPTTIQSILDIGAGTGLLSLMMAQKNPQVHIDAVEIENEAATQAIQNILASPWKDQITIHHIDILTFQPALKYDRIISNPPFYENELTSHNLKKNVAHHSADLGLESLLQIIKYHLSETGIFYLLLPYKRKNVIEVLLKKYNLYIRKLVLVQQSFKHAYFRILLAGSSVKPTEVVTCDLSICNEQQQYTPDFINLLKDYYLYL